MTDHLVFLILGLGNGATYAALALALVMSYRSAGVVNFATATVALYVAYTYALLRDGDLLVPIPGLPPRVHIADELPWPVAIAIALMVAGLLGALLHLLVFNRLSSAPAVTKAVASVGVMLALQALIAQRVGTAVLVVKPIFSKKVIEFGDVRVQGDRIWIAVTVAVVSLVVWAGFKWTRFGLATRAVAESEKGALVTGLSPQRIALANSVLSASIAGVGGILITGIVPLMPVAYTLFVVPALAAALVGRFSALLLAVGVAFGIGMAQSELSFLQTRHSWLPQRGFVELLPLVVVLIFLVVTGRPLPERGAILVRSLGDAPRPVHVARSTAGGVVLGVVLLLFTSGAWRVGVTVSLVYAVISLSLVVSTGLSGQVSLVQLGLAGSGAFLLSRLTTGLGVPFPLSPILAALGATVVGVVVGLPALRIRGLPLAVVTLALAVCLETVWFANPQFNGGFLESAPVKPPSLFGIDLGVGTGKEYPRVMFGFLCLAVLAICGLGVALLRRSRLGEAMLAVRANERAAAAAGINVGRIKVLAFAISAFIAGLGGCLLAYQQSVASPSSFGALTGIGIFTVAYLCGVTSVSGAVLAGVVASGGLFYTTMNHFFDVRGWYLVASGVAFVNVAIQRPEGIIAVVHKLLARLRYAKANPPTSRPPADAPTSALPDETRTETSGDLRAVAAPTERPILLSTRSVWVRFGSVAAVSDLNLDVPEGAIVGLIGPNGAGKTTLVDAITGFTRASGSIDFRGRSIAALKSYERVRLGVTRTFQGVELYDDLTVRENISVGSWGRNDRLKAPEEVLATLGLSELADRPSRELSQGQRQLVSIGRALATGPDLLILDEPAAGLDSSESRWLGEEIRAIRRSGPTVLLIDHDMDLVLSVCDLVHVLDLGVLIATGTPAQISADPRVTEAYLGVPQGEDLT